MLTNIKKSRTLFTLSSVVALSLVLTGCATEDDPITPPDETSDTQQPVDKEKPDKLHPKADGWKDLDTIDRCRMVIEQFPEHDPNARIELEDFSLSNVMSPDFMPDCVYLSDSEPGSETIIPTQFSIFLDADTGLTEELIDKLATIDFLPFNQTPTFTSLQSVLTCGHIRVEGWPADILLEPYVNKYDLKGEMLVVMTANYSPNPEDCNEDGFNFSDTDGTFNPDDWTTDSDGSDTSDRSGNGNDRSND